VYFRRFLMYRARLLIPVLAGLLLGPAALRPAGTMAAEKKQGTDESKTPERKKSSKAAETEKGGAKTTGAKTTGAKTTGAKTTGAITTGAKTTGGKSTGGKTTGNKSTGGKTGAPKDVTDQKSGRTKEGEGARDARTMEGRHDGEFDRDEPGKADKPGASSKGGAPAAPKADLAGWEVVHYQEREYVTSASVHRFYRFTEHKVEGNSVWFISPVLIMRGTIGSQDLMINNIKFVMSYPLEEANGKVLISRLDLCKLIDPVLRPSYIGSASSFNTVIIDAGHGGHDSGARGIYGYEKDFALKLAVELKADLEKRGLKVVMTRKDDTFISLGGRVEFANKIPNSIFVALHFNSGRSEATGIETYALSPQGSSSNYGARSVDNSAFHGNQRDSENIALATAVHAAVVHHFKMVDRGVKRARWYVLTGLERPGILFEGGFVTNPNDARLIAAENFRRELAHTIGDAVSNYRRALKPSQR